jgi:uncharacterized membrane protein YfcA
MQTASLLSRLPSDVRHGARPSSMLEPRTLLLVALAVVAAGFVVFWARCLARSRQQGTLAPTPYQLFVGVVTDFFDTLGIGSFATTTTLWRARKAIADEHIPGTLNVGHTLSTVAQAFLFTRAVEVDITTLVLMIVAAVAGSLVGAPIVARLPRRQIQIGLGVALLVLCAVLVRRQFGIEEVGTTGLSGGLLVAGVVGNFVLGALMTIGVGLYAPCLVMVAMLGMNSKTGFPIMMCSCAFLMPLASVPFVRAGSYDARAAIGLTLGGVAAVFAAFYLVESLPLYWVNWLVAAVIVYTAVGLLRSARGSAAASASPS